MRRFFVVFGLLGPSLGSWTANVVFMMQKRPWGKGRDLWGPRIEQISTSDFWISHQAFSPGFGIPDHHRPTQSENDAEK
eukprot:9486734-Pyramimonas_sp.AAC.1